MRALLIAPHQPINTTDYENPTARAGNIPLNLLTVAALFPVDWEFRVVDGRVRRITSADWNWSQIALITGYTSDRREVLNLIKAAKKNGKIVVNGGYCASSTPDLLLEAGSDFVVKGEGENTVPQLIEALEQRQTGMIIENANLHDLRQTPVPRFDLIRAKDYLSFGIQTSRGCPFDCEFCDVSYHQGQTIRYKAPDQVIEELDALHAIGAVGDLFICDDNFIGSRKQVHAILERVIQWQENHGYPFELGTEATITLGQDKETMQLLKAANFSYVFIGMESPDEEVLHYMNKRQNTGSPMLESVERMRRHGIAVMGAMMMGYDGSRPGEDQRIRSFVEESGIPFVSVSLLTVTPHTKLWERMKMEGRLVEEQETRYFVPELNYVPSRPTDEILKEYVTAVDFLYEPSRYLKRAYLYFLGLKSARSEEKTQHGIKMSNSGLRYWTAKNNRWKYLMTFLSLIYRQGIRAPHRLQFWKQLVWMRLKRPDNVMLYIKACLLGDVIARYRGKVISQLGSQIDSGSKMESG